jgi:hypothetical protein
MEKKLTRERILSAFAALDARLTQELHLVVGGGGAMLVAYQFPLATEDVDAFSREKNLPQLTEHIERVGADQGLASDWLNPFFSTFTHVLPQDYSKRLRRIFEGKKLFVDALGPEDLFIMKCFAGRDKDIPHAKALLKVKGFDLGIAEDRIQELIDKKIPGAMKARNFLDEVTDGL